LHIHDKFKVCTAFTAGVAVKVPFVVIKRKRGRVICSRMEWADKTPFVIFPFKPVKIL